MVYKHSNPSSRSLSDDDDDEPNQSVEFAAQDGPDALVLSPAQWTRSKRLSLVPSNSVLGPHLLIHILKHLHAVKDLYTALQVCRTWCECSVELLWHKPAFPKYDTLAKMAGLLDSPDQTFTYASFIRRLNLFSPTAPSLLSPVSCPLLLEIDLNHCKLITDISIRDIWTHSSHMREMRLSHCPELTDAGFPAPIKSDSTGADAPNPFPSTAPTAPDDLPPLLLSNSFEHLRMLDLTACSLVTDDAVDGIIAHAPRIRNLVLSKCGLLTDRSLGRYLHYLHLGHAAKITDRSVRTLARSCTRLRYIDFANCVLLTDMSVFELSALPKLRRVGLVRVNNLTDEAIFSLADRHATLERIHLSYCDQISVMAVHFLLQKLHKLTHLSLTGVPAFRQPELQRFCREPPHEFSSTQQMAFCVYSGKGVSQLRAFLTELFDHLTEMNGTDDTEDEEDEIDAEAYREDDTPEPDPEEADEGRRLQQLASARGNRPAMLPTNPPPPGPGHEFGFRRPARAAPVAPPAAELNFGPSLSATNQVVAATPGAGPSRATRQTPRGVADMLPIVETSRSPPPSERSAASNGGGFFRTYQEPAPGSPRNGALTPDLNYAEIGHGRGAQVQQHTPRRGEGLMPQRRPPLIEVDSSQSLASASSQGGSGSSRPATAVQSAQTTGASVVWPYREPASPTSPTTTRELQESVASALGGEAAREPRGRSVKRSLRNTLNAAEQYASSLIFGRRSPPPPEDGP
ncbi:hypothetical protein DFH06DRAFT_1161689, partial [Mycena polygramma]